MDIVVLTVPRVPEGEWAAAAAKVTAAFTAEVSKVNMLTGASVRNGVQWSSWEMR